MITAVSVASRSCLDPLEDLRLDRHVQGGRGLVGDQDAGIARQRHRDHHALAHPARELVRVGVDSLPRPRDPDLVEQLDRPVARLGLGDLLVRADLLDDLVADLVDGIERGHRILEDHRDLGAAHLPQLLLARGQQIGAAEHRGTVEASVDAAREAHQRHHASRTCPSPTRRRSRGSPSARACTRPRRRHGRCRPRSRTRRPGP